MKSWRVILATLVIFIAGLVTGAVVARKTQAKPAAMPQPLFFDGPEWFRQRFFERMRAELDLNPEQRKRLEKIFAESRERIRILREVIEPEMQAEMREVSEQLRAELTPQQQEKFEELLRKTRNPRGGDDRRQHGPRPENAPGARRGPPSRAPEPPPAADSKP